MGVTVSNTENTVDPWTAMWSHLDNRWTTWLLLGLGNIGPIREQRKWEGAVGWCDSGREAKPAEIKESWVFSWQQDVKSVGSLISGAVRQQAKGTGERASVDGRGGQGSDWERLSLRGCSRSNQNLRARLREEDTSRNVYTCRWRHSSDSRDTIEVGCKEKGSWGQNPAEENGVWSTECWRRKNWLNEHRGGGG